jgi:hypothetical protein
MRRRKLLVATVVILGSLLTIVGGYVYWQYRTAPPPPLDSIASYTPAVPVTDILDPQRSYAEKQLRDLASSAKPGYRIVNERFIATNAEFVWDAVRHQIESALGPRGYHLDRDGWSADNSSTYLAYGHGGLQRRFNDDVVVAAGLVKEPLRTASGSDVHVYGYFVLASN